MKAPRARPTRGREQRSATALSVLESEGYSDLHLIDGGCSAWHSDGHPIASPAGAGQR
jgi:rhodanese-related sulfurtransferase